MDAQPVDNIPRRGLVLVNPRTGREYSPSAEKHVATLTPKMEQAIRLYSTGQVASVREAATLAKVSESRFSLVLNSAEGQGVVNKVRGELDFKYQALYQKFINVVDDAMSHPEPAVALAGASLFAKTQIGTKHKVELSAEDVVQQIINGTYVRD